jgi:hypothetical protein
MARTNSRLGWLIIVVLVLALLYALNPTTADFQAWMSSQTRRQVGGASGGLFGAIKQGAGALAGAMSGGIAGLYTRHDYFICSGFSLGNNVYLGIFRLFLKIK